MKQMILILAVLGFIPGVYAQDVKREITRVTDDVYRFQNRFHVNMFVVTGDGVVVTDPINEGAAKWLKAEIGKITDQPITHLVYSHSHGDHASGGTEYGDVPNRYASTIDTVSASAKKLSN
jgi:glyoxylase-like metal-dependent hydrolase (beta-lactamase superfamily II)